MIAYKELLSGHSIADIPIAHQQNLQELCKRLNVLRAAYGEPMTITSGYRTAQDQRRIYNSKGIKDVPMGSAHLSGLAADIADPDGRLKLWLTSTPQGITLMQEQGLYGEEGTHGWIHLQFLPPKSNHRWFLP